jgi:hypothetical protein
LEQPKVPDKLTIAELAQAIKRREPRLASVPDSDLVRKAMERRPELINMIYTAEERPPMGSLYSRVGSRLREDLNIPKQAGGFAQGISEAIRDVKQRGIRPAGVHRLPEVLQSLQKTYKDPANAIGDILTAVILGQGGGERGSLAKGSAPVEAIPKAMEAEPSVDMATRRAPGVPVGEKSMILQERLNSLRLQLRQQLAARDPNYWNTRNKLQDVEAQYKSLFGSGPATSDLTKEGGAGANYSADQLAEFKRKHGIQ